MAEAFVAHAERDRFDDLQHVRETIGFPLESNLRIETLPALDFGGGTGERSTTLAPHEPPDPAFSGLRTASRAQLFAKRAIDIVASTAILLCAAPVLAITALLVKLSSRGPVFYIDWRVGQAGQQFKMYKFRSMYTDAERRLAELRAHNEVTGPVFKMRRDPRVTPLGRILRKLSLDEMPQLFNVLVGQMSLVGPRPPLPREYATYSVRERRRLDVRPGLTCTWQVSGRSDISFEQWIDMDLEYIDSWNMKRDLVLLIRTIPAVLSGRGAY